MLEFLIISFFVMSLLMILVIYGTIAKNRWGVNLDQLRCARCGNTQFPTFRRPTSLRQALWGGTTCPVCGAEIDKWGRQINLDRCLLRTTGNYVIAFLAYAISALLAFHHSAKKTPSVAHASAFTCFVQVIVSLCVAIFFFRLMRKTTYATEKAALALSGTYFILYSLTVLQTFSYLPSVLPSNHPVFVIITCSSVVLVGIRVVQVLAKGPHQIGPR